MPISKPGAKRRYNLDFSEDESRDDGFDDGGDDENESPRRPRATRMTELPPPPEISGASGYSEIDGQQASTLQGRSSSPRLFVQNSGHPTVTQLKVYKMDNGVPVSLGAIDAEATEDDFVKAFAQSMPQPGEGRIQFRFRPIDEENRELGLESSFWIGDEHISIQRLRARQAASVASAQSSVSSAFHIPQINQSGSIPPEILNIFARMMDRSQVLAVDERERAQQYMNQVNSERLGLAQSTTTSLQSFAERVMSAEAERAAAAIRIESERNKQASDSMSAFFATQLEMQREMQRQQAERDERERARETERHIREREDAERKAAEAKTEANLRAAEAVADAERRANRERADAERKAAEAKADADRKAAEAKADAERRAEEARNLSLSFVEREQMAFAQRMKEQEQRMKEQELKWEREKQEREDRWRREDERRERLEKEERDARERRDKQERDEKERRDRIEKDERELREKTLLATLQREKEELDRREKDRQASAELREKERQANADRLEKERQREHEMRMKMLEIESQQKREHDERMAQLQQMQLSAAMQNASANNALNFEGLIGKVTSLLQSFGVEPKDVIQRIINPPIPPTDNTAAWADLAGRIMGTVGEVAKAKMIADASRERKMIGTRPAPVVAMPGQRPMIGAQLPQQPVQQVRQPQPVPAQAQAQAQRPQAQPAQAQPAQAQQAAPNPAPGLALPQQKAARTALRELVAKLSKQAEDKWQGSITLAMTSEPAIYHYVQAVTVVKALEEAGANEDLSDRIIDALMDSPLVPDDLNYGVDFEDDEAESNQGEG